jgi:hypothetical protein
MCYPPKRRPVAGADHKDGVYPMSRHRLRRVRDGRGLRDHDAPGRHELGNLAIKKRVGEMPRLRR